MNRVTIFILIILASLTNAEYIASSPAPFTLKQNNITIVEPVKSLELTNIIASYESEEVTPTIDTYVSARHKTQNARATASSGDSYIDAYRESHAALTAKDNLAQPTIAHPTYYEPHKDMKPPASSRVSYYQPIYHHDPPMTYYSPKPTYSYDYNKEAPAGYVATSFGHHQVTYGAPSTPVHHQVTYVAPTPQVHHHHVDYDYDEHRDHHESYGMPYQAPGLFDKLKMKFNWYLLGKLLLKLILFKKFVKFIAILCLLFIIPKFKRGKNDEDDDRSRMFSVMSDDAQAALMQVFIGAMETYSQNDYNDKNIKYDSGKRKDKENCKAGRMLDKIDAKYSFSRLWSIYKQNAR